MQRPSLLLTLVICYQIDSFQNIIIIIIIIIIMLVLATVTENVC
jgi:hypothetical protein